MTHKRRPRQVWSKAGGPWTHDLVAYALDLYHRRHLRTPTVNELRHGVEGLPSHPTIRRLYGCASEMYRQRGYRIRSRGGQPGRQITLQRDAAGRLLPREKT